MKMLSRLLLAVFSLIFIVDTQAQVSVSTGPEIGFTASGIYADEYSSSDPDIFAGVNGHFGATAHIQFWNFLAIRPSVLFKTGTFRNTDFDESKIVIHRIAVPVPVLFSYVFGNNSTLFVGAGPNFMYSLSGKTKNNATSTDIPFGNGSGEWKRLDVGLQIKGGFQFKNGLALSTFFNGGFSNLRNLEYKTRSMDAFGFSIGYMFGGNKED